MRFTIPGDVAVHARKIARLNDTTRADWWRTVLLGDRLRGIGNRNGCRPVSVHRERVRFGAWEERPRGQVSDEAAWRALPAEVRAAFLDKGREIARNAGWGPEPPEWIAWNCARAMHSIGRGLTEHTEPPTPVPVEGPAISGPENAYKCEGER